MNRTQRAAWVLLAVGIAVLLCIMALQAWTGNDFLALTLTIPVSIITAALGLLGYAYREFVTGRNEDE